MPRTLPNLTVDVYKDRSKYKDLYEPIAADAVPDGVKWKPSRGRADVHVTVMLSTPGEFYKLIRDRHTGDVVYYKLKDEGPAATPKEKVDAEPTKKPGQVRYRVGAHAWFVDDVGRWFCVRVVKRGRQRITLASVTGWDAERTCAWPHGELLEFSSASRAFARMRPLKARTP